MSQRSLRYQYNKSSTAAINYSIYLIKRIAEKKQRKNKSTLAFEINQHQVQTQQIPTKKYLLYRHAAKAVTQLCKEDTSA